MEDKQAAAADRPVSSCVTSVTYNNSTSTCVCSRSGSVGAMPANEVEEAMTVNA